MYLAFLDGKGAQFFPGEKKDWEITEFWQDDWFSAPTKELTSLLSIRVEDSLYQLGGETP